MQLLRDVAERQKPITVPEPATEAVKTWRYLRLAMVVVVVGLGAAVLYEHFQTDDRCWQTSLSAYYYTPVQGFFVGALVTFGVCLIALKGNTDWEDILLNLAGVCAPVVAFVPTSRPDGCGSVLEGSENRDLNIANNVTALLVAGGLALAILAVLSRLGHWDPDTGRPTRTALLGFAGTVVLYAATLLVFLLERRWFTDWGHAVAAIAMFLFFFLNVWLNAVNLHFAGKATGTPVQAVNRYTVIGILMVAVAAVTLYLGLVAHWDYWILVIEASQIGLFALFWVLQTAELWNKGLRKSGTPSRPAETTVEAPVRA